MKTKKTRYFKKKKTIRNKKSLLKKKTIRNKSLLLKMIKKRKSLTRKYRKVSGGNDNEEVKEMEENPTNWYEDYNTTKNKLDKLNNYIDFYENELEDISNKDYDDDYGTERFDETRKAEIELEKSKQELIDFKETDEYKTFINKNEILKTYLTKNRLQRWFANKKNLPANEKITKEHVDNLRNDIKREKNIMRQQAYEEREKQRKRDMEEVRLDPIQ